MVKRLPDWHARLIDELKAALLRPFEWGQHDCCCFAARCVDAMCGADLHNGIKLDFAGYSTAAGAQRLILSTDGGLRALVRPYLGAPVPWGQAAPGDVVLVRDYDDVEVLGICEGAQVLVATAPVGYGPLPLERAACAWVIA